MYSRLRKNIFLLGLAIIASLLSLSPARLTLWELSPKGLQNAGWKEATPVGVESANQLAQLDWNNGKVHLSSPNGNWQSPVGWTVQQAAWTDLNHNNQPELTLLVQRPFEPWPVDRLLPYGGRIQNHHDADGNSSHIILIGWKRDHWGEVWAGSALARPVRAFKTADLNQDGKQELVVLEGNYDDMETSSASSLAVWQWGGFGFELVSRLERPVQQFALVFSRLNAVLILLQ